MQANKVDAMNHCKWYCLVILGLGVLLCSSCLAEEYRIDSQKRFDALAVAKFGPGDVILFKRGVRLAGMFAPSGSGADKAPIRSGASGQGARPRIDAGGKHQAGLLLRDPSYWEVSGLELTNTDGSDKDQGNLFGIYVLASRAELIGRIDATIAAAARRVFRLIPEVQHDCPGLFFHRVVDSTVVHTEIMIVPYRDCPCFLS